MLVPTGFTVLSLAACALAAPAKKVCTVEASRGSDDSASLQQILADPSCTKDATILFKPGRTYRLDQPVDFPELNNVIISVQGNIDLPSDIATVQAAVASSSWPGYWFNIAKGSNIIVEGANSNNWGWIDAYGQQWWDKREQTLRPHFWGFGKATSHVEVRYLKIRPIAWGFKVSGTDFYMHHNVVDAKSKTSAYAFNTDAFGMAGKRAVLSHNHATQNDDCVAITSGASDIYASDMYCEGSHGASLGSFGKDGSIASVNNITFERFEMVNCLYGARFKAWAGGRGEVSNVSFKDFKMTNVSFPIFLTQRYYDQQKATGPDPNATTGTKVTNFTFENISGTIAVKRKGNGSCVTDPCWYAVPDSDGNEAVILDIFAPGTATNLSFENINLKPDTGAPATAMCDPSRIGIPNEELGFVCQNGPYVAA